MEDQHQRVSWPTTTELTKVRDFPTSLGGPTYRIGQKIFRGMHVNVFTIRPGREEVLLPVQEISLSSGVMWELCELARRTGVNVWRGNSSHREMLRYCTGK